MSRLTTYGLSLLLLAQVSVTAPGLLFAEDWPAYRHDAQGTATSSEQLKLPLGEVWSRTSTYPPQPAWPDPAGQDYFHGRHALQPTRASDRVFHPVVADGKLYYGSSADDTLYCVDAATGQTLWSFVTEGPIRLTPASMSNEPVSVLTLTSKNVFFMISVGFVEKFHQTDLLLLCRTQEYSSEDPLLLPVYLI